MDKYKKELLNEKRTPKKALEIEKNFEMAIQSQQIYREL